MKIICPNCAEPYEISNPDVGGTFNCEKCSNAEIKIKSNTLSGQVLPLWFAAKIAALMHEDAAEFFQNSRYVGSELP